MKKTILLALAFTGLLSWSCNEDILELKNENQYSFDTYFASAPQFNEAIIATYSMLLKRGMFAREWYFLFDLMGNDAERDAPLAGDLLQLHDFSFGPSHGPITDLWRSLYQMVFRANVVIDRAAVWEPTLPADRALKAQYVAEARFLRGFAYFYLANLWGDVPLRRDFASSQAEFQIGRTPQAEVYAFAEADFQAAASNLPVVYDAANTGRATRGAAIAMLGKLYLYQGRWAQAEAEFIKLTKAPFTYRLVNNYDDIFSSSNVGNAETVFDIQHKWTGWGEGNAYYMFNGQEFWGGRTTHTGRNMEYGWNDWRNVVVSNAAVAAFKYPHPQVTGIYTDPRAALTFYGDIASGGDTNFCHGCPETPANTNRGYSASRDANGRVFYNYPFNAANGYRFRKYNRYETREQEGQPESDINTQVVRYADVLLMLAEAQIEQNKLADALQHINAVRARVGAVTYTTLGTQDNARTLLRRERALELCGEQTRFFDLRRWGIAQTVINQEKQAAIGRQPFQAKNMLLPIPQLERDNNQVLAAQVRGDWN